MAAPHWRGRAILPGCGGPVPPVDQERPGGAVEHHGVSGSGRRLPAGGLDGFPASGAM